MAGEHTLPILNGLMIKRPVEPWPMRDRLALDTRVEVAQPNHSDILTLHQQRGVAIQVKRLPQFPIIFQEKGERANLVRLIPCDVRIAAVAAPFTVEVP